MYHIILYSSLSLQHTITRVLESSGKEMEKGRKWDKNEVASKERVETEIPMSLICLEIFC